MALKKITPTRYGNTASYWKLVSYQEDFASNTASGRCSLFLDKDASKSGAIPYDEFVFTVSLDDITTVDARDSVYPYLKQNQLQGAEDC